MKLVSKSGGIVAVTTVSDEVKPLKGIHLPDVIAAISKRYSFSKTPTMEETNKTGAKFQNGNFKEIVVAELALFNDAVHVTTTDTIDSEAVRLDLTAWLIKDFGFREPITPPKRAYQSDLIVDFDNSPENALSLFQPLEELIQKEVNAVNGDKRKIEFYRLDFGSDPMATGANAQFILERRSGVPWATNRFFCKAYIKTEVHLKALTLMDKLLGKAKA